MYKISASACLVLMSTFSQQAWADRCDYDTGSHPMKQTIPVSVANISVGADVPVGSTVHTMQVVASGSAGFRPWLTCKPEGTPKEFNID